MAESTLAEIQFERPFWEPIGQFVINFGYLEMCADWAVGALLQIHHRQGEAVTSRIQSLHARISLIEKLCLLLTADVEQRKEMGKIVKEILALNTYRNDLVHGPWRDFVTPSADKEAYWQKISVKRNFKHKVVEIRLSEIQANTNRTIQANARLTTLVRAILREQQQKSNLPPSNDSR